MLTFKDLSLGDWFIDAPAPGDVTPKMVFIRGHGDAKIDHAGNVLAGNPSDPIIRVSIAVPMDRTGAR